jgi:hypothetical protein
MNTIYVPGVNPAISLYNLWHTLLATRRYQYVGQEHPGPFNSAPGASRMSNWDQAQATSRQHQSFGFGRKGWEIGVLGFDTNDQPVFGYGRNVRFYGISAKFALAADGRFYVQSYLTPTDRTSIEMATFLASRWQFSRYQWHVGLEHRYDNLADPDRRIHYVSDYAFTGHWYELYQGEHGHGLRPAQNQNCPGTCAEAGEDRRRQAVQAAYQANNGLVERRYLIAENRKRAADGLPKLSARTATVRDGGQVIDTDAAVLQIAALMDVTQPAKTVPLRPLHREAHTNTRLKEAQHG